MLDDDDNIFVAANERNAVAVVTEKGRAVEFFRNAAPATRLRNEGPLEFPTSPVLVGRKLCLTNSDGTRRDNFPNHRAKAQRCPAWVDRRTKRLALATPGSRGVPRLLVRSSLLLAAGASLAFTFARPGARRATRLGHARLRSTRRGR